MNLSEDKWIPVTEEDLPPYGKQVLCSLINGEQKVLFLARDHYWHEKTEPLVGSGSYDICESTAMCLVSVEAWQPLPKRYQKYNTHYEDITDEVASLENAAEIIKNHII